MSDHTKGELVVDSLGSIWIDNEQVDPDRLVTEHKACDGLTDEVLKFVPELPEIILEAQTAKQTIARLKSAIAVKDKALQGAEELKELQEHLDDFRIRYLKSPSEREKTDIAIDIGNLKGYITKAHATITAAIKLGTTNTEETK